MIRVLFVDDDPLILAGIKRLMRRVADEIRSEFATSGEEALQILGQQKLDAIVSDMRMPNMDGAELLMRVRQNHPDMVRFILSGQAPNESKFRALGPAHRFLSKPCSANELKDLLLRVLKVRDRLANSELQALVSQVHSLPCLPNVYSELIEELHSPKGSIDRVGEIVSRDVAITAKILHLINSSFFGMPQHIDSPSQAVALLGIELVKSLALTVGVFSQFRTVPSDVLQLEQLAEHSIEVGKCAQRIASQLGATSHEADEALLAGMMHDVGKLVLAAERQEECRELARLATGEHASLTEHEEACFGTSHADIGAYLLSTWGLPNSMVEAVAYHHTPSEARDSTPVVVTAVHLANAITHEEVSGQTGIAKQLIDFDYLSAAGIEFDGDSQSIFMLQETT